MLLLNPRVLKQSVSEENPSFAILMDNSQSILLHLDTAGFVSLRQTLQAFQSKMKSKNVEVTISTLTNELLQDADTLTWLGFTDLDQPLRQLKESSTGTYFQGALLLSDGVYNKGSAPFYRQIGFPVYTIGIGDTIPIPDIAIEEVQYNRTVYAGNDFEVIVYIKGTDLTKGVLVPISLSDEATTQQKAEVKLDKGNATAKVRFIVNSKEEGIKTLSIKAGLLQNEKRAENNQTSVYVDVVKSKERILIAAAAPHPDLKALRLALEQKQQLEVSLHIVGIHTWPEEVYDLIILHQLPNQKNVGSEWVSKALKSNSALWVITGNGTNYNVLSELGLPGQLKLKSLSTDQATAQQNPAFSAFQPDPTFMRRLQELPPLAVPFGDYTTEPNALVPLQQKIGNVATTRPFLAISTEYPKKAIWFGEGLWLWRLQEGMIFQESSGFDAWVGQLVQFLSAKQDKSKLRLFTQTREYYTGEDVMIQAETFDELLNPIYGKTIEMSLTKKGKTGARQVTFENTMLSPGVKMQSLEPGLYTYTGETILNQKKETARGNFVVKDQLVELSNPLPDHNTLRQLSAKTDGIHKHLGELETMLSYLEDKTNKKPLLHSNLDERSLLSLPWVLLTLLVLVSMEWVARKSTGQY